MSNEQDMLRQCIASGQVSPEQIAAHEKAGDLDTNAYERLARETAHVPYRSALRDPDEFPSLAVSRDTQYSKFVQTTLLGIARELGISVDELRAKEGQHIPYRGGSLYLIPRLHVQQSLELRRAQRNAVYGALAPARERLGTEFRNTALGLSFDEVTIPRDQRKTCISCGAKQEADGSLPCGH